MESLWFILFSLVAAILVLFWRETHYRRQVRGLIQRLDQLEVSMPDEIDCTVVPADLAAEEQKKLSSGPHAEADVLHGRTTFIEKLVAGENSGELKPEEEAILAIYQNITEPYSPTELSEHLCISLRTLERVLSQTLGCTPRELIIAVKMREALRLMREESLSVTSTAYRLGFSSPSHFSRRFKAFYQKPPSQMLAPKSGSRSPQK